MNAQVLFHTDDLAGFDVLKIARVKRGDSDASIAKMDAHYIPPLLDCASNQLLRTQLLSSLYDIVQTCSETIARQLLERGSGLNGSSSIEMQRLIALQAVNPAAAVLSVMANTRGNTSVESVSGAVAVVRLARFVAHHKDNFNRSKRMTMKS